MIGVRVVRAAHIRLSSRNRWSISGVRGQGSVAFQPIANATHAADLPSSRAQVASKPLDVSIHGSRCSPVGVSPHGTGNSSRLTVSPRFFRNAASRLNSVEVRFTPLFPTKAWHPSTSSVRRPVLRMFFDLGNCNFHVHFRHRGLPVQVNLSRF